MGTDLTLANDLSLSTRDEEPVELVEAELVSGMSLTEYKREKDILAAKRQQVVLQLDGRKLRQATQVMDRMDGILDKMMETIQDGTAQDVKFLAEAYEKMSKTLATVTRLDTVDGTGKAARLALDVQFGNGSSVRAIVEG